VQAAPPSPGSKSVELSQQSTLTHGIHAARHPVLQAIGSIGKKILAQAPFRIHPEAILIPFTTQSAFLHSSFRTHSEFVLDPFGGRALRADRQTPFRE